MYVHLENVLVHMINAQDVAIFKFQKDYERKKQKFLEYICDAAQVLGGPRAMEHTKECLLLRRPGC